MSSICIRAFQALSWPLTLMSVVFFALVQPAVIAQSTNAGSKNANSTLFEPVPPVQELKAKQMVQASVTTLGGLSTVRSMPSWTIDGTITSRNGSSHQVHYEASGNEYRIEHRTTGSSTSMLLITSGNGNPKRKDGSGVKYVSPVTSHTWIMAPMVARMLQRELDDENYSFHDAGPAPISTSNSDQEMIVTVNHKTLLDQIVTPQIWYIDKTTMLPAKVIIREYRPTDTRIYSLVGFSFSNYQAIDGIMVPFQVSRLLGDTPVDTTTVTTVDFKGVSSDDFAPLQ